MRAGIHSLVTIFLCALFSNSEGVKTINDFSRLNRTIVADIVYPRTIEEIEQILRRAQQENKKISVAGKRHSQGGHAFYHDAIVIDMCSFNKILNLNVAEKVITVQTGATWEQIQNHINPYGLAIKVMQTVQIFTVGGSLSVNAHGRDPRYGPLIETVRAVRILLASGEIVEASKTKNDALFKLAIGGYGLFGIILEADIELTDNTLYRNCTHVISIEQYPDFICRQVRAHPDVGLHYGMVSIAPYNMLKEMVVVNYVEQPTSSVAKNTVRQAYTLRDGGYLDWSGPSLNLQLRFPFYHDFARMWYWPATVLSEKMPDITCRNNAMRHPAKMLEYSTTTHVQALCAYFIPLASFARFMQYLRNSFDIHDIRSFAMFTRYIPRNTESFLSYTKEESIEVVVFLAHENSWEGIKTMQQWTQSTVGFVLEQGGTYYLPGNLHPTYQQITTAYPQLAEFFQHKRTYDPAEMFINHFYMKYSPLCRDEERPS